MSFDEENDLQAANAFFAGSHTFDIIDAEFTYTTGTMTKLVTYNESNNSGFNNHYGNVYRGSRNLSTTYNGAFVDHRQIEARQYDTNLIHSQTHNHYIPAPGGGQPQFNPNCQKHGAWSPSRSPRSLHQHHYILDAPLERPSINPDTRIQQRSDRDLPSSLSSSGRGRGREREGLASFERNTWNQNPNQSSNQNQSSWDSDASSSESQSQPYSYANHSSNRPGPSEPPLAFQKPKSMAKNPYAEFIRIATEPVMDQPAPPYVREPPRSSSYVDVEMEISPGEKAAAAAKLRRAIQESEAMLED